MRRWLIAAGLVVVVLVGALVVAMANLSRMLGTQRDRLAERATRELGRPVELGDLTVSMWRGPGLRITGVRVAEAPEWGGGDLLRADEVWVTARLLPALAGRFEVARVTLRRPVLTVIRDQRGWNLATLGRQRDPTRPRPESASRDQRRHLALLIGLADMRDGEVRYVDRRREPAVELVARQVQASASDVTAGRPVPVGLQAALFGAEKANVSVKGSIGPVADPPVPAETPIDLEWTLDDTDAAALAGATPLLDVTMPRELIVAGPLSAHGHVQGPADRLSGAATVDASAAALRLGTAFAKAPDVAFTAALDVGRDGEVLAVRRASLALGDATLDVTGSVQPGDPPSVDLHLESNRASLAALASVAPAAAGAEVGGTIEAQLAVQGAWRAQPPPAITGTVALADVRARRPGDRVGLSGLTATVTVADGVARTPTTRFQVGESSVEASAAFQIAERLLTVDGKSADVFGGTIEGTGRLALADPKLPHIALEGSARGVALRPLLAARDSPAAEHIAGRLDADVSLTAAGARRRAVRRSLTGTARVDVRNGVLHGVEVVDQVLGAVTGINGAGQLVPARLRRKQPELFGAADTEFEELRASVRIVDRHATTDDLVMRTDAYVVTGRGQVGFDGQTDLNAVFVAGPSLTSDVLDSVKDARWALNADQRIEVPFRVAGRFPDLRPRADPDFVARVVGRALEARARKALGGDGKDDRHGGLVNDAIRRLQQLFGR